MQNCVLSYFRGFVGVGAANYIPESIVASLTHDIFINGCQYKFEIDGHNDVEACELYSEESYTTVDDFFDDYLWRRKLVSFLETCRGCEYPIMQLHFQSIIHIILFCISTRNKEVRGFRDLRFQFFILFFCISTCKKEVPWFSSPSLKCGKVDEEGGRILLNSVNTKLVSHNTWASQCGSQCSHYHGNSKCPWTCISEHGHHYLPTILSPLLYFSLSFEIIDRKSVV